MCRGGIIVTLGEKISQARQQKGLSQEQLAQKMSVSVQTVMDWENSQAVPDTEKLAVLKSILSFTDENNVYETAKVNSELQPFERYRFIYSPDEISQLIKAQKSSFFKMPLVLIVLLIILIIFSKYYAVSDMTLGFAVGASFIMFLFYLKSWLLFKNNWKKSKIAVCNSIYDFELFSDFFNVTIYRNNELICERKIYYYEIERIIQLKYWLLIQINSQYFIVRKSDITENSAFYRIMNSNPKNNNMFIDSGVYNNISIILFALSLISLPAAFIVAKRMCGIDSLLIDNIWVSFLFLPIPVASLIYGIVLSKKGSKYKINIVIGIIFSLLLCVFGLFSFVF